MEKKGLGTLADWAKGDLNLEHFTEPSMVEPCHNLSIEEILRDYSLGIVHSTRQALYDPGDSMDSVDIPEDIVDFMPETHPLSFRELDQDDTPSPVSGNDTPPLENLPEGSSE